MKTNVWSHETQPVQVRIEDVREGDLIEVSVPAWRVDAICNHEKVTLYGLAGPSRRMSDRRIGISVYFNDSYSYAGRWTPGSMVWVRRSAGESIDENSG